MSIWEHFLNSLATRGGNILVLIFFVVGLFFAVLHVLHHGESAAVEVRTVVMSTFSGFSGALLQALVGGQSRQRAGEIPTPPNGKPIEIPANTDVPSRR